MVRIEGQRPGLHRVTDLAVQHSNSPDLSIVSNANYAVGVVKPCTHLAGTNSPRATVRKELNKI